MAFTLDNRGRGWRADAEPRTGYDPDCRTQVRESVTKRDQAYITPEDGSYYAVTFEEYLDGVRPGRQHDDTVRRKLRTTKES